jgi:hypothetical protein
MRFALTFPRARWHRINSEQMTAIWLVIGVAYLVLGLRLLGAWFRITMGRAVFSDDVYRNMRSVTPRPRRA